MNTTEQKTYSYVFIRRDLSVEQQVIQATHAGMQMAFSHSNKAQFSKAIPNIVLVVCENEEELSGVQTQLECDKIEHTPFYEPDIGMALTSIVSVPLQNKEKTKFLKKQKLAVLA